jgi:hypothetical protein
MRLAAWDAREAKGRVKRARNKRNFVEHPAKLSAVDGSCLFIFPAGISLSASYPLL